MNAANLPSVAASGSAIAEKVTFSPLAKSASAGSSTSTSTIARSSTTSQPTAMRPRSVSSRRRSCKVRSTTTVLATDSAAPKISPALSDHPCSQASAAPSTVATAICASAPGTAMARTDSSSCSENCSPTPNISRMMPSSESSLAIAWSATKPGVNGPMMTPASRYPTSGEALSRCAIAPSANASTRPTTMVERSGE